MSYDFVSVRGDEYYTAERTVRSIAEALIPVKLKVWCPCDEDWSAFVKVLPEYGHEVVNTSTDFFTTKPPGGGKLHYHKSAVFKEKGMGAEMPGNGAAVCAAASVYVAQ